MEIHILLVQTRSCEIKFCSNKQNMSKSFESSESKIESSELYLDMISTETPSSKNFIDKHVLGIETCVTA